MEISYVVGFLRESGRLRSARIAQLSRDGASPVHRGACRRRLPNEMLGSLAPVYERVIEDWLVDFVGGNVGTSKRDPDLDPDADAGQAATARSKANRASLRRRAEASCSRQLPVACGPADLASVRRRSFPSGSGPARDGQFWEEGCRASARAFGSSCARRGIARDGRSGNRAGPARGSGLAQICVA